jgi:signal transduction histidine kinase
MPGPLTLQLEWFIRLRWIAAAVAILGATADGVWLKFTADGRRIFWLGVAILAYNIAAHRVLQSISARPRRRRALLLLAWAQLLLDFAALTLLIIWTDGVRSPLLGFFVFHMVVASLLLPTQMAYASAAAAALILATGLGLTGQFPSELHPALFGLGQIVTLFMVVFVANRITRSMRRQQQRLREQNRRIRKMSRQVRRQQRAMIQHEKMVALGQMAAGVTHEIANPLASLDGLLQLMQRKPEKLRPDAINTLREQTARINQIVQQMKAFSHPIESEKQAIPLHEVVEKVLQLLRFDPRMRRVAVSRDLAPSVSSLPVLPLALEQVMLNLIINSLDAMSDVPKPALAIRAQRSDGQCLIEISDNGHGIRAEHMKRLFEPFFTTKPIGAGTGLGLSISYSLIRRQHGNISVRSELGEGTTFTIHLPVPERASQNREQNSEPNLASGNA